MGSWKISDYVETIRLSVSFTRSHYISVFLAILGVFVITVSLCLLILFLGSILFSAAYGPFDEIFDVFDSIGLALERATDIEKVGIALFAGSAILAPFLIALGALFGMGQEIMESGSITAEEVLLWYRQKFSRLAAGGISQFLLVMSPIGIEYILAAGYYGEHMPDTSTLTALIAIAVVWFLVSSGVLSMLFPSIVDGMSVSSSIKHSIVLSLNNIRAVFSIWMTFSTLGLLLLGPIVFQEFTDFVFLRGAAYDLYIIVSVLILALVLLPVYVLSATRVYLIISDPNIREVQ